MTIKTHTSLESFMVGVNKYIHFNKHEHITELHPNQIIFMKHLNHFFFW